MIIITSRIPKELKKSKSLSKLIQGYLYSHLPESEHDGYVHSETRKNFKRTNFDFSFDEENIQIRFTALDPELEKKVAVGVLKNGVILGNTLLKNTCISSEDHHVAKNVNKAVIKGYVACAISGLLGNKVYLEPQNPQHLENMKNNALQRYETLFEHKYSGEFELKLLAQNSQRPTFLFYGSNQVMKVWEAEWEIKASSDLINLILDTGVGSGCMNFGAGFLEVLQDKVIGEN